jgi:hypothetical protein
MNTDKTELSADERESEYIESGRGVCSIAADVLFAVFRIMQFLVQFLWELLKFS